MNWRAWCPRDRYIKDRPTNAPPAGCSDDDENWRSKGDEIASKSLATGYCFPTNLVILPGGSTVDEKSESGRRLKSPTKPVDVTGVVRTSRNQIASRHVYTFKPALPERYRCHGEHRR